MSASTVRDLWHLFHELHYEIDDGNTAPVEAAQDAIIDGTVLSFVDRHTDIDLSIYSQSEQAAVDDAFSRWGVYDKKRTGVYNNGLALIQANCIMVVQNAVCVNPDTDETVSIGDLELH